MSRTQKGCPGNPDHTSISMWIRSRTVGGTRTWEQVPGFRYCIEDRKGFKISELKGIPIIRKPRFKHILTESFLTTASRATIRLALKERGIVTSKKDLKVDLVRKLREFKGN